MLVLGEKGTGPIGVMAFSPDGRELAVDCQPTAEAFARVWDLATGQVRLDTSPRQFGYLRQLLYSPDGQFLVLLQWQALSAFEARSGEVVQLRDLADDLRFVAFRSPGLIVGITGAAITHDHPGGFVVEVDLINRTVHQRKALAGLIPYQEGALSPDGHSLAALREEGVGVYDLAAGQVARSVTFEELRARDKVKPLLAVRADSASRVVAWAPDGSRLFVSVGKRAVVFDAATLRPLAAPALPSKHFQAAAFTPDGRWLLTVSNEETARVWDTTTWAQTREYAWKVGPLRCLAVSADGTLAAGSSRGKVVVWDLEA